jgi:hypothetical protein
MQLGGGGRGGLRGHHAAERGGRVGEGRGSDTGMGGRSEVVP